MPVFIFLRRERGWADRIFRKIFGPIKREPREICGASDPFRIWFLSNGDWWDRRRPAPARSPSFFFTNTFSTDHHDEIRCLFFLPDRIDGDIFEKYCSIFSERKEIQNWLGDEVFIMIRHKKRMFPDFSFFFLTTSVRGLCFFSRFSKVN